MDGMIYNQTQIPKDQWCYGFRSSAATGCGWIAVYNALRIMGFQVKPEGLIRYFERQLPLIHGNTGTSLWGPALYFRKWGFPVQMTVRRDRFDQIVRESDACILFYRWCRGWRVGAHFVALHNTPGGDCGLQYFPKLPRSGCLWIQPESFFGKKRIFWGCVNRYPHKEHRNCE